MCVFVCACVCVCACAHACVSACMHACLHACVCACVHACVHMHTHARMCLHVCMCVCMHARVCLSVSVWLSVCLAVYVCMCVRLYVFVEVLQLFQVARKALQQEEMCLRLFLQGTNQQVHCHLLVRENKRFISGDVHRACAWVCGKKQWVEGRENKQKRGGAERLRETERMCV